MGGEKQRIDLLHHGFCVLAEMTFPDSHKGLKHGNLCSSPSYTIRFPGSHSRYAVMSTFTAGGSSGSGMPVLV